MSLKERFHNLSPGQKKTVVCLLICILILFFVISGYNSSRSKRVDGLFGQQKTREIQIEPDLIQKTLLHEQRRELAALRDEIEKIKKEPAKTGEASPVEEMDDFPEIPTPDQVALQVVPPPPPPITQSAGTPPAKAGQEGPLLIGNIAVVSNKTEPMAVSDGQDPKKKGRTVYLPPSFMEASLLTGFDASTSGNGRNNPEPLLLRIQTPAVLPNDIKANLRGCFVIAEAVARYPENALGKEPDKKPSVASSNSEEKPDAGEDIDTTRYRILSELLKEPKKPLLQPPKILRVLMLPYEGERQELYMSRFVYIQLENARWVLTDQHETEH